MEYEVAQSTRIGDRNGNQDRARILERAGEVLLVVADGMGGHPDGELAARTLVDKASEAFHAGGGARPSRLFRQAIEATHEALLAHARGEGLPVSPGTTAVLCLIREGRAHWAHVGDSRLYLFRNGRAIYRTRDHSYVEDLFQQGLIDESELAVHPMRAQITECVGCQEHPPPIDEAKPHTLHAGDTLLLCTDGLWEAVATAQVAAALGEGPLQPAVERLTEAAEYRNHPTSDNITAAAFRYRGAGAPRGRAGDTAAKPAPAATEAEPPAANDPLQEAIERIQKAFQAYRDEVGGDD